jgi:hypothetical protein
MGWLLIVALLYAPEPYGGCDEAHAYVATPGWTWCAVHGRL